MTAGFKIRKGEDASEAGIKEEMMLMYGEIAGRYHTQQTIVLSRLRYEPCNLGKKCFKVASFVMSNVVFV